MVGSWDSYYVVFLSAILSLTLPGILALISYLSRTGSLQTWSQVRKPGSKHLSAAGVEGNTILGQRINVRFFLAANAALVLFAIALELVPCVATLQGNSGDGLLSGLVAIVSIAGFAVLGLLYSVRKGDMAWVESFRRKEDS